MPGETFARQPISAEYPGKRGQVAGRTKQKREGEGWAGGSASQSGLGGGGGRFPFPTPPLEADLGCSTAETQEGRQKRPRSWKKTNPTTPLYVKANAREAPGAAHSGPQMGGTTERLSSHNHQQPRKPLSDCIRTTCQASFVWLPFRLLLSPLG